MPAASRMIAPAMFDWAKLLGFRSKQSAGNARDLENSTVRLLAITSDDFFYSMLVNVGSTCGWEVRRAGSIQEGLALVRTQHLPLVIFDWNESEHDWRDGIGRLSGASSHPCVLLASRVVDDNLRQEVLRHRGYDVLPRSADQDEIMRAIEFAWFGVTHSWGFRDTAKQEENHN